MGDSVRQIQLFRNNGFLCLPDRLPEEMVENLKTAITEDIDCEVEPISRNKDGRAVRISALMDRVYLARDIPAFIMYCVYGESCSSLLIESTDSLILYYNNTH